MDLDEAQRFLDALNSRSGVGLKIRGDLETINALGRQEPEHEPVAQGLFCAQFWFNVYL
jgi:hypothetical protein